MAEERAANRIALLVKPDDIAELQEEGQDFLKAIRTWKNGLSDILASKTLKSLGLKSDTWQDTLKDFGGRLLDFLRQTLKSTEQYSLEPSNRLLVETFLKTNEISVYIDDLDRGWQGRQPVVHNISALLNAARDLSTENPGIRFRISLRSDVYFLIRTSDESTDKIEGSVVWQSYDLHEIFCLLVKRIETFFGRDLDYDGLRYRSQSDLSQYLDPVMDPRFYGHGKWSDVATYRVLLTLIRKRPRDPVKLCTLAASAARSDGASRIGTRPLQEILEEYSQGPIAGHGERVPL